MSSDAGRTIRGVDGDVPIICREWKAASGVLGYRKTYALRPGEAWADAPIAEGQYEHLVGVNGQAVPVGVAICRDLLATGGGDWALTTEQWAGKLVLLDADVVCVDSGTGQAGSLIAQMREANGGRLGGLPRCHRGTR